jgi:hypothetical protein
METVVLKGDDFSTVHNTLCELREIEMRLNEVLKPEMVERLHRVIKGFEAGLADAYAQDNAAFESKMEYYDAIRVGAKLRAIWSIYDVTDMTQDHPYEGALQVAYKEHWGGQPVFAEIQGSTWADLYRAADQCIRNSGDDHHIFIEQFRHNPDEPTQLLLSTGS